MQKTVIAMSVVTLLAGCAHMSGGHHGGDHHGKAGHHGAHWSYEGDTGPAHWGDLSPDFALCKTGKEQSPIDIDTASVQPGNLGPIEFHYRPLNGFQVINNGHTFKVPVDNGSYAVIGGKRYDLLQFHFHVPSEHTIDGEHVAMVAHLVHKAADGQLGVIGVLMSEGAANPALTPVWQHLPQDEGKASGSATVDIMSMLPADKTYYNYSGSLTTPPCSEGVNWNVLKNTASVSSAQVDAFTRAFPKSARPVQPLNDRVVTVNH